MTDNDSSNNCEIQKEKSPADSVDAVKNSDSSGENDVDHDENKSKPQGTELSDEPKDEPKEADYIASDPEMQFAANESSQNVQSSDKDDATDDATIVPANTGNASVSEDGKPKGKANALQVKIVKIICLIAVSSLACLAVVRISKPILRSLASYILSADQTHEDDFSTREVSVEAEKVVSMSMPKHINTIGELKANASVIVHSEISGRISEILFTEGSSVKKGALLIKLDDDIFQAELRAYQAQYEAAKAEFARLDKMRASGASSGREYDKALSEMNLFKAKCEGAAAQLKRTEIRAPFDGTIGLIDVGVGSYVQPNQEIVTVVDQTPIKVKFGIPGKFVNDVGVGQSVEIKIDAFKDRIFRGSVEAVDSFVDSATNCVSLRASVPNENGLLKAGLYASVSLVIGIQGGTITVDESAIQRIGEQEYVWIVDRGKVRHIGILTGTRDRGRIEVIAGLKEGQIVVTAGHRGLVDGKWVRVVNMTLENELAKKGQSANAADDGAA
ncbi:MAG: efflux RND transporter periplasmic adaptor subunit [Holosporales bacterium]|jgi:membrane fusion protein (multidrug efflux system)|nr:efflux RND transporter periplasmic adaptor subunit [Holosporales bacterium]